MNKSNKIYLCVLLYLFIFFPVRSHADSPPPRYNQNGRTMLMIFSGYYSWWTGIVAYEAWGLKWSIKTKKDNLVFSTIEPIIIKEYLKQFHKRRIKAKITDKMILNKRIINRYLIMIIFSTSDI